MIHVVRGSYFPHSFAGFALPAFQNSTGAMAVFTGDSLVWLIVATVTAVKAALAINNTAFAPFIIPLFH
jgi:hypothetical protein